MKITVLISLWLIGLTCGFVLLEQYKNRPGPTAQDRTQLPPGTELQLSKTQVNLIMFAHPRCPCSRASVTELTRLVLNNPGKIFPQVIFFRPTQAGKEWFEGDIIESAKAVPNAQVIFDPGGKKAKLLDAKTSGQTFVFDSQGIVQFMGGMTGSRGHEGENIATRSIASIVKNEKPLTRKSPVFGCSLFKIPDNMNVQ